LHCGNGGIADPRGPFDSQKRLADVRAEFSGDRLRGFDRKEAHVTAAIGFVMHKPFIRTILRKIDINDVRDGFGTHPAIFEDVRPIVGEMEGLDVQHLGRHFETKACQN